MPVKLYVRFFNVFLRFFQNPKKHDFLRFFELLHTFPRTVMHCSSIMHTHADDLNILAEPHLPFHRWANSRPTYLFTANLLDVGRLLSRRTGAIICLRKGLEFRIRFVCPYCVPEVIQSVKCTGTTCSEEKCKEQAKVIYLPFNNNVNNTVNNSIYPTPTAK